MKKLSDPVIFPNGASIKNRFVQPPMLTNSGNQGEVTADTIQYYGARSDSAGMVTVEYAYVSENGGPAMTWAPDHSQLAIFDDRFVPQLKKLAEAIKSHGNKAIIEIAHDGRQASGLADMGKSVYAPSEIDYSFLPYPVKELNDEQIKAIIKDFGKATKRAIDAGFDGVLIHGANHYLLQQFFSTISNKRDDHWGGSLEKRMNFPLAVVAEVLRVVKESAPNDFIVGYRFSPEEIHDTIGYTWHESTQLIKALTDQFAIDYIDLSLPQYDQKPIDSNQTFAEIFKPFIGNAKLGIVGNIRTASDAQDALKYADLLSVGRGSIADPNFARKVLEGHGDRIVDTITKDNMAAAHLTAGLQTIFADAGHDLIPHWPKKRSSLWN
ncbi:NADH-dependent flavin oxidoreductase [Limosilactobacillus sp.]|uniref:oxidoreductase n=1 Tax=Limosilactobacillus sp. TaxID=2773925 RepID=UPI00345E3A86